MDRNVHADLPFSEDAFIDADIVGAVNIDPTKEVFYNTTEYWDSHPEIIAAKGIIYIYSDYKTIDDKTIPGIKVGDGSSYLIDIPFSDIETEVEVTPVVTEGETLATIRVNGTSTDIKMPLPFVVNYNGFTIDKTYNEILAAIDEGREVQLHDLDESVYELLGFLNLQSRSEICFVEMDNAIYTHGENALRLNYVLVKPDNSVEFNEIRVPDLPVPNNQRFVGQILAVTPLGTGYMLTTDNTILDTSTGLKRTWSARKINTELQARDAEIALKADSSDVDTALALKADKADTYTKTQVNAALSTKANTEDVAASLALKADKADTYTKAQVDNIINNLPEPMIFKGTLGINGTISDLPVASSDNDGYTYKVITDGTYQGIAAKVGDVFTSNGVEWVLIPSGDDVEDTWRTIKVNGTEVLNSSISSGFADFVEGDNIEIIFNSTGHTILFKTKNIYTKAEVNTALNNKADKSTTYTKSEVDTALAGKSNVAVAPIVTSGVDIATVTVDGTPTTIKAPAQVSEIDDTSTAQDKTWSGYKLNSLLILDVTNVGV